jgi:hypothetical protein
VVLSPLDLSALGSIGQFGNLNFSIARVQAFGENGRLLAIGSGRIQDSPIQDVSVPVSSFSRSATSQTPRSAFYSFARVEER